MQLPFFLLLFVVNEVLTSVISQNITEVDVIRDTRRLARETKCIKWGNTFDVSLSSKNVERNCKFPDGRKICCVALESKDNDNVYSKPIGSNFSPERVASSTKAREACTIEKKYFSSNQELRDFEKAKQISLISSDHMDPARVKALVEYAISEEVVRNSTLWLDRVQYHMSHPEISAKIHPTDFEFLSRFEVTRRCNNEQEVEKWMEWIEPITITARHPFAFGRCRLAIPHFNSDTPRTDRSNVDYVLLQSGHALHKQNFKDGKRFSFSGNRKQRTNNIKHFMFDAGTSTFDSSLFWFTCGYSQRKVGFDQIFGWEMTLLEPTDYWSRVPPNWKPYWHFYNVPIAADATHPDSPRKFIEQIATPQDFVAFKLDIDNPDMEMPIALSLLSSDQFTSLVDEFFFELHFRCEVMTSCGWGKRVPSESHGLKLDRPEILDFFMNLRKRGIRAHIWP